jgi:hypothetical protein
MKISIRSNIAELQARIAGRKRAMDRAIRSGMVDAKPAVRAALQAEQRGAFNVKQTRFLRTWRISVRSQKLGTMLIDNIAKGFSLHAQGGTVSPRHGSALLIPINTVIGSRIGAKKFYALIDWLRREKLTIIKNGILYVRPPMNTSRRGGVEVGTLVQKKFRFKFSGTVRRPVGFDIKLNEHGLTPIAVVKRSISLRKRWDMPDIVQRRVLPLILDAIEQRARGETGR